MKKIFTAVLLAALAAGCAYFNAGETLEKSKNLRVGMTKDEVLAVMGEPLKNESYHRPDLWYYYFDCNWMDGLYTEEECFPLVFKEGKLIGWGNKFYAAWRLENRDRIPNVELPKEANTGSAGGAK